MESVNINLESTMGSAILGADVFKNIAQIVSGKIEGVYPAKKESDFVVCKIKDAENIKLTLYIRLRQGIDVAKTCSDLQRKVHEDILDMTGIDSKDINLDIQGFVSEK